MDMPDSNTALLDIHEHREAVRNRHYEQDANEIIAAVADEIAGGHEVEGWRGRDFLGSMDISADDIELLATGDPSSVEWLDARIRVQANLKRDVIAWGDTPQGQDVIESRMAR